jgi:hypothetical protein
VLLDRHQHVGQHRRAAGTGDGEQVRKPGDHQTKVCARPFRPIVSQTQAVAAADVDAKKGAGHGIEAGGQNKHV